MKLVELAMVQIVISMEDGRCFSTLVVMKSKFHNRLITHLPLIVHVCTKKSHHPFCMVVMHDTWQNMILSHGILIVFIYF